jgi:hypothetical protein
MDELTKTTELLAMHQIHDVEVITWRKLPGNQLNLSLYPAMLIERSYRQNMLLLR